MQKYKDWKKLIKIYNTNTNVENYSTVLLTHFEWNFAKVWTIFGQFGTVDIHV